MAESTILPMVVDDNRQHDIPEPLPPPPTPLSSNSTESDSVRLIVETLAPLEPIAPFIDQEDIKADETTVIADIRPPICGEEEEEDERTASGGSNGPLEEPPIEDDFETNKNVKKSKSKSLKGSKKIKLEDGDSDEKTDRKSNNNRPRKTKDEKCYILQRSYIQKSCLDNKSSGDIYRMLKSVYGENTISRAQAHNWYKMFKAGRTLVQDSARSGRPPTSRTNAKVAQMKSMIRENPRISIRNLAALLGISFGSVYEIISKDLKLRRVADQFVPATLPEDQRDYRLAMCRDVLAKYELDPSLLSKIVVGAETFVFSIPNKKYLAANVDVKPFYVKMMLIFFFDMNGLIHYELVPPDQTPINANYYFSVMLRLYQAIFQKRSDRWNSWDWYLFHDYSSVHNSFQILEFLTKNNITAIPTAPNSPDLSPFDAILYQKLKYHFSGKLFDSIPLIQEHTEKVLNQISPKDFAKCFKQWPELWRQTIRAEGDYYEKDTTNAEGTKTEIVESGEQPVMNGTSPPGDPATDFKVHV